MKGLKHPESSLVGCSWILPYEQVTTEQGPQQPVPGGASTLNHSPGHRLHPVPSSPGPLCFILNLCDPVLLQGLCPQGKDL